MATISGWWRSRGFPVPFKFSPLELPGLVVVEPRVFTDSRGSFLETYKRSDFARAGIQEHFVQDNCSRSSRGVLRGLHFQIPPRAQGKLVQCVSGAIYDVAVDIRQGSPSYGQWAGIELSGENNRMLYLPPGFAHGFLVLSGSADVVYKCTDEYAPENDRGIIWNDPAIGIQWPEPHPLLSDKDRLLPLLSSTESGFRYAP